MTSIVSDQKNIFQQMYKDITGAIARTTATCSSVHQPLLHPQPVRTPSLSLTEQAKLSKAEEAAATMCNRLSCMYEICNKKLHTSSAENRKSQCGGVLDLWSACYVAELQRVGLDPHKYHKEVASARDSQLQHAQSLVRWENRWEAFATPTELHSQVAARGA